MSFYTTPPKPCMNSDVSLPTSVFDVPRIPPPRFAGPPIVYMCRPRDASSTSTPQPLSTKFADPPIVYVRRNMTELPASMPTSLSPSSDTGSLPSTSNVFVNNLSNIRIPEDYKEAASNDGWRKAMEDEIAALSQNHIWELTDVCRKEGSGL